MTTPLGIASTVTAAVAVGGGIAAYNAVPGNTAKEKQEYFLTTLHTQAATLGAATKERIITEIAPHVQRLEKKGARLELAFQLIIGLLALLTVLLAVNLFVS